MENLNVSKPDIKEKQTHTPEDMNGFLDFLSSSLEEISNKLKKLKENISIQEKDSILDYLLQYYQNLVEVFNKFYSSHTNQINDKNDIKLSTLHNLKGSITAHIGLIDLIQIFQYTGESTNELYETLKDSLDHSIKEDISLLRKMESGDVIEPILKKVDIESIVNEVTNTMSGLILKKGILLSLDIPKNLFTMTDLSKIRIVLEDIITNAIKFSNIGGKINISAREINGMIELKIKDNGVGIPSDKLLALTKEKVQSTNGTSGETGTGTGLILNNRILKKLGGTIKVESDGLDQGTTVTINILTNNEN